ARPVKRLPAARRCRGSARPERRALLPFSERPPASGEKRPSQPSGAFVSWRKGSHPAPVAAIICMPRFLPLRARGRTSELSRPAVAGPAASAEHLFEFVDEALGERMVDGLAVELGEFLQEFALAGGETARCLHHHANHLIAAPIAMQIDDALALEPQHFARLGAGGNLELDLAVQRRHVDFASERRLRKADRHFNDDVVFLAGEELMLLDVDDDVQVASGSSPVAGLAFAPQLEPRAIVDTGRNAHGQRLLPSEPALSLALGARVGNDHPFAAALAAGCRDRKEALLSTDLAAAPAVRTLARTGRSSARATAVARVALGQALETDCLLGAPRCFLELDLEVVAQIVAAARAGAGATAAGTEKIAKDVGEDFFEALREIEAARTLPLRPLKRAVAEAIVLPTPIG